MLFLRESNIFKLSFLFLFVLSNSYSCLMKKTTSKSTSIQHLSKFKSLASSSMIKISEGSAEINGHKLEHLIDMTKSVPSIKLIVDFYNPSCPHCKNFAPIYENTALDAQKNSSSNMFLRVDVTKYNFLVKKFGINFIPDVRVIIFNK